MRTAHYSTTPDIQQLVQHALGSLSEKVAHDKLAAEASHQTSADDDDDKDDKKKDADCGPSKMAMAALDKTASELCAALDFAAAHLAKQADFTALPAGAGPVSTGGTLSHDPGQAHQQPAKPRVNADGSLVNTLEQPPGGGAVQHHAVSGGKVASAARRATKLASGGQVGTAPPITEGGTAAPVPAHGRIQGDEALQSNRAAIDLTARQAYAGRKKDLSQYLREPAMNAATDKVLHNAFNHTDEAGAKISSAQATLQLAAQSALLAKVAKSTRAGK